MCRPSNLIPAARIIRSFGTVGKVTVRLSPDADENLKTEEPVFIEFDGLPVPFFIDEIVQRGSHQFIIKFDGVDDQHYADELCGKTIYTGNHAEVGNGENPDPGYPEGFTVKSTENKIIGRVTGFYDFQNNPCLGITINDTGEEKLLPLAAGFIVSVNRRRRELVVDVPDGLFDI
jgi:16S rRNA processing protein RimM